MSTKRYARWTHTDTLQCSVPYRTVALLLGKQGDGAALGSVSFALGSMTELSLAARACLTLETSAVAAGYRVLGEREP